jgi:hypothetical protein
VLDNEKELAKKLADPETSPAGTVLSPVTLGNRPL